MSSFRRTDVVSNMINAFAHGTRLILTAVSNFRWYGQSLPTYHIHVIPMQSRFQSAHREKLFFFPHYYLIPSLPNVMELSGASLKCLWFTICSFNFKSHSYIVQVVILCLPIYVIKMNIHVALPVALLNITSSRVIKRLVIITHWCLWHV